MVEHERYTSIVTRAVQFLLLAAACFAQQPAPKPVEPAEEDESFREKEYTFNPLQASKEFQTGNFYWKRGSWKAAALRFEEATKWNPGYGEAYLRWAEALEKMKERERAKEVFAKFLEVAPEHKRAPEVRKKIGKGT